MIDLSIEMPNLVGITLIERGHNIITSSEGMGVTQFISIDPDDSNLVEAVSDPRKNGKPFGQ